jgi:hypothetical protein
MAPGSRIDRELVRAAAAVHRRRLVDRFPEGGLVAVRVPTSPDTIYATLMADGGESLVALVVGPDALERTQAILENTTKETLERASMLLFSMQRLGDVAPELRGPLERAGLQYRRSDLVPVFSKKRPGQRPKDMNRTETRTMLFALNSLVRADEAGKLRPSRPWERDEIPLLLVSGEPDDPAVEVGLAPFQWRGERPTGDTDSGGSRRVDQDGEDGGGDLPEAGDLAAWKAADSRACGRIARAVIDAGLRARGPIQEFFDDEDLADACLEMTREDLVLPCFEWIFADYRPRRGARTLLDRMLDGNLPPVTRALFEARRVCRAGLYRVAEIRRGESFDVVDVASGVRATVHDKAGSDSVERDIVFVAKLYTAGSFTFAVLLSPPFRGASASAAIAFLERAGAGRGLSNLGSHPELAGRLFALYDDWAAGPVMPTLVNTDGEPLEFQDAVFGVTDPEGARRCLEEQDDLDFNESDDSFEWLRRPIRKGADESGTVLGRIRIVGEELLLHVNSRARLERARGWLERIPGISFEKSASRSMEELMKSGSPLDDRMPDADPPPPGIHEALQQFIERHAMAWLDEAIPALGGKTPRAACRSAEGRRQVRMLINTWPDQRGPDGRLIETPRSKMLRALGIAEVEAAE